MYFDVIYVIIVPLICKLQKGCVFLINGSMLRDAIISASNNIVNNKKNIDDLNIFPVPDGDTGTNMSMTISAAARELEKFEDNCTVSEVASKAASCMLRGARGNSGVILSILFRGFANGLQDKNEVTGADLANALSNGVEAAYKSVMKPTEGTILTVARVASEVAGTACEINSDPIYVWGAICSAAEQALAETPELLPVLKKANVVDAGGKGLCDIFEGMLTTFKLGEIISIDENVQSDINTENFASAVAEYDGEITFTYCTEFIVEKENDKNPLELRAYLETIGDSVVVVDDEEIIKVHVHTEDPGNALQSGLAYGQLLTVKIENMREQQKSLKGSATTKLAVVAPEEEIGFVSIAAGDGLKELFTDLGCSHVVSGGQTMNPSTEDIMEAVLATPCKKVVVLPNNKNILMAAQQAVPLVTDREVIVIPTKTIPQGITALLTFDPDSDAETNEKNMTEAIENVGTGLVTFAARDSEFGGHKIKEGEVLGLVNGKMDYIEKNPVNACLKVTKDLVNKNTNFVTLIYGENISDEEAEKAYDLVKKKLPNHIEISVVNGGQPVYYFIISVE